MARFAALLALVLVAGVLNVSSAGPLTADYYKVTCPKAESTIRQTVYNLYSKKGNIATSLIRFSFHDWFNVSPNAVFIAFWCWFFSVSFLTTEDVAGRRWVVSVVVETGEDIRERLALSSRHAKREVY